MMRCPCLPLLLVLAIGACGSEDVREPVLWVRDGVGDTMVSVTSHGFAADENGLRLVDLVVVVGSSVPARSFTLQLVRDGDVVVGHEDALAHGTSRFGPYALPGEMPERMQDLRAILSIEIEGRDPLRIERTMSDADRAAN